MTDEGQQAEEGHKCTQVKNSKKPVMLEAFGDYWRH